MKESEVAFIFQIILEKQGVPPSLAKEAAKILERDGCGEDSGRTPEEQHLISSAWEWMRAKGVFR